VWVSAFQVKKDEREVVVAHIRGGGCAAPKGRRPLRDTSLALARVGDTTTTVSDGGVIGA
jgi:hypothetical protein